MQLASIKILLIEDNAGDAYLLQEILAESQVLNFSIQHVERLQSALSFLQDHSFDVILSDLSLPDAQGLDTIAKLHALAPNLPIIVLTHLNDEAFAIEAMRMGAQDYLVKGQFNHHLLAKTIRYAVERSQTQRLLYESLEKFRDLVETSNDWVWEIDTNYVYTYASPAIRDILGYSPQEVIGKSFFSLMSESEGTRVRKILEILAASYKPFKRLENTNIHKDGYQVVLETNGVPFFAADRTFQGYRGSDRDVTERKLAEALLQEREQQLESIMDNSTAVIFLRDKEGKYILVNRQFEKLFKVNRDLIKNGITPHDIFPEDVANALELNNQTVLESAAPLTIEELVGQEDGIHYYISVLVPLFDSNGNPNAVCGISTDITLIRRAEAEIRKTLERETELARLRSQFISTVSHEFRTPLTSIMLSTELLQSKGMDWDLSKRELRFDRIKQAVKRMTQLLEDILIFSQTGDSKLQLSRSMVNVEAICLEVVEEIQHGVSNDCTIVFERGWEVADINPGNSSQFSSETNPEIDALQTSTSSNSLSYSLIDQNSFEEMPLLYMDEKILRYILINLLSNAIKYSTQSGTVRLVLNYQEYADHDQEMTERHLSGKVIFKIHDSGIGIALEDQNRIFESFQRGNNVGTIAGTGLGLSIAKRSVELHNGEISVLSEVGVGTTFTVKIPV